MKKFLFILAAFSPFLMQAQSLTPTVIASTGGYSTGANVSLSYTVGEMTMVQTFTANNNILTTGFQQPNEKVTGLIDVSQGDFGSFVVYPNPAVDNIYFGFQLPEAGKVNVVIYDNIGQKVADVYSTNYESGKMVEQTNVSLLSSGMYMMTMTFTSSTDGKTHIATKKFQVVR